MVVVGDLAHGGDDIDEVLGTAVAQIVAVDAGDDDVTQLQVGLTRSRLPVRPASGGSGLPWPTSQKGSGAQMSPRIMKVAVPRPKHLADVRQAASSHRVQLLLAQHGS